MIRHEKMNVGFSAGQKQKISAREQKVALLNALSPNEIDALNKSGKEKMEKIVSSFEGYVV